MFGAITAKKSLFVDTLVDLLTKKNDNAHKVIKCLNTAPENFNGKVTFMSNNLHHLSRIIAAGLVLFAGNFRCRDHSRCCCNKECVNTS